MAPARILVVDDEESIAQLLAEALRGAGHAASYVTDGSVALDRMRGEAFDLLLTDLRMPGLDGMRLIEEARHIDPELDVLVMTAYASADSAVRALRGRVADYVKKPFGIQDVRAAIDRALEGRRRRLDEKKEVRTLAERVVSTSEDLERRVADLSFLHELSRLAGGRSVRLRECLSMLRDHLDASAVLLIEGREILARAGAEESGDAQLLHLARLASLEKRAVPGSAGESAAIAAPVLDGAVAARRAADFESAELQLLSIAGRDLALAVENDRLRAQARRSYVGIVATLIEAVEAKDRYNRGHSRRVAELACRFAEHAALPRRDRELLETAAKLHDIGKIGIPEEILNKRGRLTDEEFDVIKAHPVIGEQILRPLDFLAEARPIVRHHHERWDGSGYPDGLAGNDIPRAAAMLAVLDAFDAMTSTRPYREGLPPEEARARLRDGAGLQWDPELVELFDSM